MDLMSQYIEIRDGVRSGKPCIAGTRITVADVAIMYLRMGKSLEEIAGTYQLPLPGVYMAMAFYFEHRQEIEERTAQAEALAEEKQAQQPSLLKEKLKLAQNYA
jgi:uncharacterized protein (DUF433 family)